MGCGKDPLSPALHCGERTGVDGGACLSLESREVVGICNRQEEENGKVRATKQCDRTCKSLALVNANV